MEKRNDSIIIPDGKGFCGNINCSVTCYIRENSGIKGKINVTGDCHIGKKSKISGNVKVTGDCYIGPNVVIKGIIEVFGNLYMGEHAYVDEDIWTNNIIVHGNFYMSEYAMTNGCIHVDGNAYLANHCNSSNIVAKNIFVGDSSGADNLFAYEHTYLGKNAVCQKVMTKTVTIEEGAKTWGITTVDISKKRRRSQSKK